MAQAKNVMAYNGGLASGEQVPTVQQLMELAVKRRDELNVFIRVVTEALTDAESAESATRD